MCFYSTILLPVSDSNIWSWLLVHLESIKSATLGPGSCTAAPWDTGYPGDDDSDESVGSLHCGLSQIHPSGKQVCLTDPRPNTLQTYTHSNTHFLWSLLAAASLIPIGLSLWLQIFFTCSMITLGLRGHNKSSPLFVVGAGKKGHLFRWFVRLFRRLYWDVCWGEGGTQIPFDGSFIVSTTQPAGESLEHQSATHTHTQAHC